MTATFKVFYVEISHLTHQNKDRLVKWYVPNSTEVELLCNILLCTLIKQNYFLPQIFLDELLKK